MDPQKQNASAQQDAYYDLLELYTNYAAQYRLCHWAQGKEAQEYDVTVEFLKKCGISIPHKTYCELYSKTAQTASVASFTKLRLIFEAQQRKLEEKIDRIHILCEEMNMPCTEPDKLIANIYKQRK